VEAFDFLFAECLSPKNLIREVKIMFIRLSLMQLFNTSILISFFSLLAISSAGAETLNFRVFSYYTKVEVMPIGFVKAPASIIYEKRGLADIENGGIALFLARGSVKATPEVRTIDGYTLLTFEDGSTIIYDLDMKGAKSESTQQNYYTGTGKIIQGTGRFVGIQGEITINGQGLTEYNDETKGDAYFDVTANYSIPSK